MQMKLKILAVIHIMFGGSGLFVGLVMFAGLARDSGHSALRHGSARSRG
jgi:hypothetical protein